MNGPTISDWMDQFRRAVRCGTCGRRPEVIREYPNEHIAARRLVAYCSHQAIPVPSRGAETWHGGPAPGFFVDAIDLDERLFLDPGRVNWRWLLTFFKLNWFRFNRKPRFGPAPKFAAKRVANGWRYGRVAA